MRPPMLTRFVCRAAAFGALALPLALCAGPVKDVSAARGAPVLTKYVVADKDANGPFVRIPADIMERAQLNWLGYESAAEALAEKFHVSPRLLRDLNPRKEFIAGTEIVVPDVASSKP